MAYEAREREFTPLEGEHFEREFAARKPPTEPQRPKADWVLRLKWIAGSLVGWAIVLLLVPGGEPAGVAFGILLFWWVVPLRLTLVRPPPPSEEQMSEYRRSVLYHKWGTRDFATLLEHGHVNVEHVEASRVVLLEPWIHYFEDRYLFDAGDGRIYVMEAAHFRPENEVAWPNSVFEVLTGSRTGKGEPGRVVDLRLRRRA